jgi:hypothetical protein
MKTSGSGTNLYMECAETAPNSQLEQTTEVKLHRAEESWCAEDKSQMVLKTKFFGVSLSLTLMRVRESSLLFSQVLRFLLQQSVGGAADGVVAAGGHCS